MVVVTCGQFHHVSLTQRFVNSDLHQRPSGSESIPQASAKFWPNTRNIKPRLTG